MTDFIGPEFIPGAGCDKDIVSTVGTPDNRAWGLFDNRESFVPTALNHSFCWYTPECRKAIPSGNSRGYKIGRTSGTGCYNIWNISGTWVHGCAFNCVSDYDSLSKIVRIQVPKKSIDVGLHFMKP